MTQQQKLNAVETAIRKALPRLMEPTEGRLFEDALGINYEKLVNIDRSRDLYSFRLSTGELYTSKGYPKDNKILGHDILLSDVLEWIEETRPNSNLTIELNRVSSIREGYSMTLFIQLDDLDCNWYLSKPHLKDQSKELIEFLYNLSEK